MLVPLLQSLAQPSRSAFLIGDNVGILPTPQARPAVALAELRFPHLRNVQIPQTEGTGFISLEECYGSVSLNFPVGCIRVIPYVIFCHLQRIWYKCTMSVVEQQNVTELVLRNPTASGLHKRSLRSSWGCRFKASTDGKTDEPNPYH